MFTRCSGSEIDFVCVTLQLTSVWFSPCLSLYPWSDVRKARWKSSYISSWALHWWGTERKGFSPCTKKKDSYLPSLFLRKIFTLWKRDGKDPGLSLNFRNVYTSPQRLQSRGSLWLFMTYKCLQGPGPHFLLKYKYIPSELGECLWNSLTILSQEAKFSVKFIQKTQMVQKHKNIFSTSHSITAAA